MFHITISFPNASKVKFFEKVYNSLSWTNNWKFRPGTDKSFSSLKGFSFALMNHIVIFCDKTIKEKYDKIDQTDSILNSKQSLKKQNTKKSKKLLHQMKPQKTKILHQWKFKKYNKNLKYKSEPNLLLKRQI